MARGSVGALLHDYLLDHDDEHPSWCVCRAVPSGDDTLGERSTAESVHLGPEVDV